LEPGTLRTLSNVWLRWQATEVEGGRRMHSLRSDPIRWMNGRTSLPQGLDRFTGAVSTRILGMSGQLGERQFGAVLTRAMNLGA
jgi:hypothetical protein